MSLVSRLGRQSGAPLTLHHHDNRNHNDKKRNHSVELTSRLSGSKEDKKNYEKHIAWCNKILKRELKKYGISVKILVVATKEMTHQIKKLCRTGKFAARIWESQIETVAEVIHKIIKNPHKSGLIIGSTQLGKTMTIILSGIVEAIMFCVTGDLYKVIYLEPNKDNLLAQTKADYENFNALYDFQISYGDSDPLLYSTYKAETTASLSEGENTEHWDMPIWKRNNSILKDDRPFMDIVNKLKENNVIPIAFVDENLWGSGNNPTSAMKQILDIIVPMDGIVIGISAVPFNMTGLSELWKVKCRTYNGFVGYGFWEGELLDSRYPLILPNHQAFDGDFVKNTLNIQDLEFVNNSCYKKQDKYEKEITKHEGRGKWSRPTKFAERFAEVSHEEYREFCELSLVRLVNECLVHQNNIGASGFIVRFFNKIEDVTSFFNRCEHLFDKKIALIPWQDENSDQELEAILIAKEIGPDDLKAIFVTGGGRMGVRIRDEDRIYYGAEFSEESDLAALLNGLLGRLTGDKSVAPTVFMSGLNCKFLQNHIDHKGGKHLKSPTPRTKIVNGCAESESIVIWNKQAAPDKRQRVTFKELGFGNISKSLDEIVKESIGNRKSLQGHKIKSSLIKKYLDTFNEEAMRALELSLKLPPNSLVLHMPTEVIDKINLEMDYEDIYKTIPYTTDTGCFYDNSLGFRTADKQSCSNSNLKSDRLKPGERDSDVRFLQPQIHCLKNKSIQRRHIMWEFIAIKFRLTHSMPIRASLLAQKVLPTNKDTAYDYFASDYEKGSV